MIGWVSNNLVRTSFLVHMFFPFFPLPLEQANAGNRVFLGVMFSIFNDGWHGCVELREKTEKIFPCKNRVIKTVIARPVQPLKNICILHTWNSKSFKRMFGYFQPFPIVKIWFIIQLKQPVTNGWPSGSRYVCMYMCMHIKGLGLKKNSPAVILDRPKVGHLAWNHLNGIALNGS